MNDATAPAPATPALNRSGSYTVIIIALLQAVILYLPHRYLESETSIFANKQLLFAWYTVAILAPGVVMLLMRTAADRYAWAWGAFAVVVDGLLAAYTGAACVGAQAIHCDSVAAPYCVTMALAHFMLLPFVQVARDHGRRLPYTALFENAWDNALTLAATLFYVGVSWLILWLWAALFDMVGISFFRAMFREPEFWYPVTGMLTGAGIVLARHQAGALHAVLRVCLALGRALLPLIAILTLVFLPTLLFTGLQPLWDTRRATLLLLLLVFGTVVLVNAVLHDGTGLGGYRSAARRLMGAALLTLPVYATLALVALAMRVKQYAWTVDRLWGAIAVFVALAYALSYAASVLVPRKGERFGWLAPANTAMAVLVATILLLVQSPLLDLRKITVSSQLARHAAQLDKLDFAYLRFDLGRHGYEAVVALKDDPRVKASAALTERVERAIAAKNRWDAMYQEPIAAEKIVAMPEGTPMPDGMLDFINRKVQSRQLGMTCDDGCVLVALDLMDDREREWVLMSAKPRRWTHFLVFARSGEDWAHVANVESFDPDEAMIEAIRQGRLKAVEPDVRDLAVGGQTLRVQRIRRAPADPSPAP
jgi:hypothetical protein